MSFQQPNILFICSDQHQTLAAGCYGHTEVQTPNIDRLAATGVRFNRAYCQSPVCVPARGSIITGLYPHQHRAKILQDSLPAEIPTIAHHFSQHGYQTAAIGKMNFVDEKQNHGFDYRLKLSDFRQTLTDTERQELSRDQNKKGNMGRPSRLSAHYFQDTYYAEETERYLRQKRDANRPFILWASFFMPHTPLVPMLKYFNLYNPEKLALPQRSVNALTTGFEGHLIRARQRGWYDQTDAELSYALAGYYGNISQMDADVGKVLDTLHDLGLDQNTIIVYTSDHGEMAGAHRMWTKHNMYEQSVNVPLIIRLPGDQKAGTVQDHLIEHIDIYPTLAELCQLPAPNNIQGRSFAPLFSSQRYIPRKHVYSEYHFCHGVFTRDNRYVGQTPILMVRTDKWKLNHLSWGRSELFDLEEDPNEFMNVIDQPEVEGIVCDLVEIAKKMYSL